jgi:hypothetical protein
MKAFVTAKPDLGAEPGIGRDQVSGADTIAISERAKRQIGAQASERTANLAGRFSDSGGFCEGG